MRLTDGRSFSRTAQAERRRVAVELYTSGRLGAREIAATLGVNQDTVWRWVRNAAAKGEKAFEASEVRGHHPPRLSEDDVVWMRETLVGKTPEDFGQSSPLWTLHALREVLRLHRGRDVPISTLHASLHRAKLVPRSPQRRARERRDSEVERWHSEVWPTVRADADAGKPIYFLDEAQVRADAPIGRTWSRRGQRPVVRTTGKRPRVNLVSAVTWTGDLLFELFDGSFNASVFCGFLDSLAVHASAEFVVVLDGLRVHHCRAVREHIDAKSIPVRIVQLPAYCPDLNPDEHVWAYLKAQRMRRHPLRVGEDLREVVLAEMLDIRRDRERVRSFFGHPDVRYLHHDALKAQSC